MERETATERFTRDQAVAVVVDAVASAYGAEPSELFHRHDPEPDKLIRGTGSSAHRQARRIAALVLRERLGLSDAEIADTLEMDPESVPEFLFNAEWSVQNHNQGRVYDQAIARLD